jgi:hypothetical protein
MQVYRFASRSRVAFETSPNFTYKRLLEDTYFISEPQIKFREAAEFLRAKDDRVRPLTFVVAISMCPTHSICNGI